MQTLAPTTSAQLTEAIAQAAATQMKLEIRGGGSKAEVGASGRDAPLLDMRGFTGILDYDPAELVLTVGAGTPLEEVETLLAGNGQMLAFEPIDYGPILGSGHRVSTIGGIVGAGVSGSRRVTRGAVRDHLLGFTAVSGRGELFTAGAKVVKNVTGYDLPKLAAGSWGRLAAFTELTLKVLPAPRDTRTLVVRNLNPQDAWRIMAKALGSQADIAAAAHLPFGNAQDAAAITILRLEGFGPSVTARVAMLVELLEDTPHHVLEPDEGAALWDDVRSLAPLGDAGSLWRASIPARALPALADALKTLEARWLADWGGGLVWIATDGNSRSIREIVSAAGGHAALLRGSPELRQAVPTFHPPARRLGLLEEQVRRAFDPAGVFETGRFGGEAHAN